MKRSVYISARCPRPDLATLLPEPLRARIDETWESIDDAHYIDWRLAEPDWPLLPELRRRLRELDDVQCTEKWLLRGQQTGSEGTLFQLKPPVWGDLEVVAPNLSETLRCDGCRLLQRQLVPELALSLQLPRSRPGLVWVQSAGMMLMASELWTALHTAGMDTGLQIFDTQTLGAIEYPYVGLYSSVDLGWPVAPFGAEVGPCELCGGCLPRNAFYYLFERPPQPADWMAWRQGGPSKLVVSQRVYRWLRNASSIGAALAGQRVGWAPDELELAFLPAELQ